MTLFALKLFLAPGFLVAASLAARTFGARVAGTFGGLPVIAGPILLVLALERGRVFAARAASGNALGLVALMAFVLTYAAVGRTRSWRWSLAASWLAFGAVTLVLVPVRLGPVASFAVACAACALTLRMLPRPARQAPLERDHSRWDLPLRAACAAVPVLAVTAVAAPLGPHTSGLLAAFPIVVPVLAAFTQAQGGWEESVRLLRGFTVGFFAYGLFCFTVAETLERLGTVSSFALATALALALQAGAVAVAVRHDAPINTEIAEG
ncbi:MAG: hypothetical protein H0X39_02715 [Actinobacteria bacterium]|nr:hypothetical protein [Actinomycetota bacterium]